ncbi:crossover junction endodeoxyribonuclease RuvC [Desulfobacterota bacterium AH_259_B03_O07]|nr:crossover junction endodeoxyribonuclease RuvC [Desulfobacterota bacterium AH_259_B03_O07]
MRVIGVDPGTRVCGFGILESENGKLTHIKSGSIVPPSSNSLPQRLKTIYEGLNQVIKRYLPEAMSIEGLFFAKNAKSAIKLGEARGVAYLAAALSGMTVHEYAPTEVKLALTGRGRANKTEVQKMVTSIFGIKDWGKTDASDAVAIALCHINFSQTKERYGVEVKRTRRRRRRFLLNDLPS